MSARARKIVEPLPEGLRLELVVPGVPVPAARPRAVPLMAGGRVVLKDGRPIIRAFTPPETLAYEKQIENHARQASARLPAWQRVVDEKHAVRVSMHFVRPQWKGDIDNLMKGAFDGLGNAESVFFNDNRIIEVFASVKTDRAAAPKLELVIEPVEEGWPLWAVLALEAGWTPPEEVNG